MPDSPPHFCNEPGCHELTKASRCPRHTRAHRASIDSRGDHRGIYKTAIWQRLRVAVLKDEPWCRKHLTEYNEHVPATVVDHVIPLANQGAPFDRSNLQPLCKPCHDSKTAGEVWHGKG